MKRLCLYLNTRFCSKGETIYHKGDTTDCMYIIKKGKVKQNIEIVTKQKNQWPKVPYSIPSHKIFRIITKNIIHTRELKEGNFFGVIDII